MLIAPVIIPPAISKDEIRRNSSSIIKAGLNYINDKFQTGSKSTC